MPPEKFGNQVIVISDSNRSKAGYVADLVDLGRSSRIRCASQPAGWRKLTYLKGLTVQTELLFSDWARSLLPETRLVSYYIKELPIYWNIDIEFSVPDGRKSISKDAIKNNEEERCLKLWCLTLKHIHRGNKPYTDEVPKLYSRVLRKSTSIGRSYISLMKEILDSLSDQLPSTFISFLDECEKELTLVSGTSI